MREGNLIALQGGRRNEPNGPYDLASLRFQLTRADRFVNGLAGDPELVCSLGDGVGGLFLGGHSLSHVFGDRRHRQAFLAMLVHSFQDLFSIRF